MGKKKALQGQAGRPAADTSAGERRQRRCGQRRGLLAAGLGRGEGAEVRPSPPVRLSPRSATLIPTFDSAAMPPEWYGETRGTRLWASPCWAATALCLCWGRGLPRLQVGSEPTAPAPRAPATVLGCAASEINRVQLSCGLSSFCRQETRPHSRRHCCRGVVPSVGRDSLCESPAASRSDVLWPPCHRWKTQAWGGSTFQASGAGCLHPALQPSTCARGSPSL